METTGLLLERNIAPYHLPFLIGDKIGLTEQYDINLEVVEPSAPFTGVDKLYKDEVQFMLTQPLFLLNEFLRGGKLTAISQLMATQSGILFNKDAGLEEPADIKQAERIMYRGIDEELARKLILDLSDEIEPEDLSGPEFVRCTGTGIDEILNGETDVLLPADIVPEGVALQQEGAAVDFWFFTHFDLPENGRLILTVADKTIDLAPNQIQTVVSFLHEATKYVKDNIRESQDIFRENYPDLLNNPGMESVLQSGPGNLTLTFSQDFNLYTTWGEWFEENTTIEGFVDLDRLIDERFIPIDGLDI
ncbi:MAG: ABC transporter substrate-binding protein [bacterium]